MENPPTTQVPPQSDLAEVWRERVRTTENNISCNLDEFVYLSEQAISRCTDEEYALQIRQIADMACDLALYRPHSPFTFKTKLARNLCAIAFLSDMDEAPSLATVSHLTTAMTEARDNLLVVTKAEHPDDRILPEGA